MYDVRRTKQNVDIDIRVGVHSGEVFAGVIGTAKLQYDIWGRDVIIANHLEATGVPSYIHVSERTLQLIIDFGFEVHPGTQTALADPYLVKHNINTFLIRLNAYAHKSINLNIDKFEYINTISPMLDTKGQNQNVEQELAEEFKKMPVGPSGICKAIKKLLRFGASKDMKDVKHTDTAIGYYMMQFHDPRLEISYVNQPDYLLKYSILLAWIICLSLAYTQMVFVSGFVPFASYLSALFVVSLTMLLIVAWYKKLCIWRYSNRPHRYSQFSCYLFRIGENIQSSLVKRMSIYLYTISVYFAIVSMMLMDCDKSEFQLVQIESKLYHYEPEYSMCFPPWVLTTMVSLIISMSLIFTRIPIMMKVIVSTLAAITYLIVVFFQFEIIMHHTFTTNPYLSPEYCHGEFVVIILLKLYFKERQTEFNNKINFKWRVELLKKQHDGYITDQSISVLLHNILPSHVVNVYLNALAKHEFYYENYEMVAVMFASLKNFPMDLPNLRLLNEIISEFDRILTFYRDYYVVEKIKIVGCTYMAACGLDVRFSKVYVDTRGPHDSVIREVMRARRSLMLLNKNSGMIRKRDEVVFVLTTFALDLMRTLWVCNKNMSVYREIYDTDLSIGISSGEVMAGVVGASQVHYDIWGNAVNMASRMDSTGVAGKIQVTEETATILVDYGVECSYRGLTYVKGRGTLPTYFVDIDDNYEFKYSRMDMDNGDRSSSSEGSTKA
ncbi:adenylyl cyclase X E isoform X2 [Drosophila grimshawi]|uniref:adenylyl cyclase X E isoform X2 n=1 Tax=Drosophila grimshawi TaxID=7222 RepID=UPI000C870E05|nr:adenylyl cyclase X E isoform X2 [Drosophila grimshawi]